MGHGSRVLAVVLLAGCYAPPSEPCVIPCEPGVANACPGDLVCGSEGYCGNGEVCSDGDTDSVPDARDNCPERANNDQHDEDDDQLGDACDPCPHVHGSALDSDGDGVGDACDPQPMVAKQRIRFFEPFTSLDTNMWQPDAGWSLLDGKMRGQGASAYMDLNVPSGEIRIATGGTIVSIPTAAPHSVSVAFGSDSTGAQFHYAEFYDESGAGGGINIMRADGNVYSELATTGYTGALPTGAWSMTIDESVGQQHIALASRLAGTSRPPLMTDTQALLTSPGQSIYITNAVIEFDYYLVIETLP